MKIRIIYLLLFVLLLQPALSLAAEKDSGSFFGRRKTKIEKKSVEPEIAAASTTEDSTNEPKNTNEEASSLPALPKPPAEQNHGYLLRNLPPGAPQDITQLPPLIAGTPEYPKAVPNIPMSPSAPNEATPANPITPKSPIAFVNPISSNTDAPVSPSAPKNPMALMSLTTSNTNNPVSANTPSTPVVPINPIPKNIPLSPSVPSTTNSPNTPPKAPEIPKTK